TLVKNNYNVTQHLIRTTNFLATISTLSMDLRNDGTHRRLIPLVDPELEVLYYISYLKSNRETVKAFLQWAGAQTGGQQGARQADAWRLQEHSSGGNQPLRGRDKRGPLPSPNLRPRNTHGRRHTARVAVWWKIGDSPAVYPTPRR